METARAFSAWAECATTSPGTVRAYLRTGRLLVARGQPELDALTRESFVAIMDELVAQGRRPATVNNHLNGLKTVLAWIARREGEESAAAALYAALSLRGTRIPRGRVEPRDHYERDLYLRLLPLARAIAPWFGELAFPLACFTGVRRNELRRADREDFDLERRLFYVRRKTALLGPAGEVKNGEERAVSLCSDAIAVVLEHAPRSGPIFPALSPRARTPYMSEDILKRAMRELARRSGIRCTYHRCRRTFATWAFLADVPLEEVSRALGHKDPAMTRRHYIQWLTRYVPAFERLSFGRAG